MNPTTRVPRRRLGVATLLAIGLAAGVLAATVTSPASAATDLALGKVATTDSTEPGRGAELANDGNPATRWCAVDGRTGHWWQVDLGSTAELTSSTVVWEFARDYRYVIAVSVDGVSWSTVVDRTNNAGTAQTRTDTFTATARHVRITVTGLAAGTWASMWSFSVFGTAGTPPAVKPFKGVANSACPDLTRLNVAWYYNWTLSPGNCAAPGFVPTVSGRSERTPEAVTAAVNRVAAAGYRTILGFNEPNKVDQANMTLAQVLQLWPYLTANAQIRVGSPSTSGDAQAWFRDFMTQADARGLRVDFINLHWYGWNPGSCDANAATFENYIRWAESLPGNRPIWITEFGCLHQSNSDQATVERFYAATLRMFARHPRIERYAWYPWIGNHALVGPTGALTPLGTAFANAPAQR